GRAGPARRRPDLLRSGHRAPAARCGVGTDGSEGSARGAPAASGHCHPGVAWDSSQGGRRGLGAALMIPFLLAALAVSEGDFVVREFHFASGETLPELRLHYRTLGTPGSPAVLVLHGTTGSGAQVLGDSFAGALFGPDQLLDAAKHFIILPDGIGHGGSSKPSDPLRARFPHYGYADVEEAPRRLLVEKLGVNHLRLLVGASMGCA